MRQATAVGFALCVMAAVTARAMTEFATRAYVVSVDAKTKTITVRHTDDAKKWKETVAVWRDDTEWQRCDKQIWDCTAGTAELVKGLAKDAKVYVTISDHGDGKKRLEKLKTIPPGETVD